MPVEITPRFAYSKANGNFYDILDVQAEELAQHADLLMQIHRRQIDGAVIRNLLSGNEVAGIINNLDQLDAAYKFEVDGCGGFLYPLTFNQLRPDENYTVYNQRYFEHAGHFRRHFKTIFKVDLEQKITDTFLQLAGGRPVNVAPGMLKGTSLTPMTLRVFTPGRGGVWSHCHNNYDSDLHPEFAAHLGGLLKMKGPLSFFIMLNKPEQGGELSLLNIEHMDAEKKGAPDEIIKKTGEVLSLANGGVKKMPVVLNNGDMVIFNGGDIWHQVEDINGTQNRVTIGGFGNFTLKDDAFYYWS